MWCHYCRKANHDDAQCHCTRPVDWRPKPEDAERRPGMRAVRDLIESMTCSEIARWLDQRHRTR